MAQKIHYVLYLWFLMSVFPWEFIGNHDEKIWDKYSNNGENSDSCKLYWQQRYELLYEGYNVSDTN